MARAALVALAALALAPGAWSAGALAAELRFDRISVEDGLSHASVWDVFQDSRGFVWIATESFLQRYDGYQLEAYKHDPEDRDSLSASEVSVIYEDRGGNLWFGTRGAGVNRLDRAEGRFVRYGADASVAEDLLRGFTWDILEDRAGALWVATEYGLHHLDPDTAKVTRYRHDPARAATGEPGSIGPGAAAALLEDRAGRLWIGGETGLDRLDGHTAGGEEPGTFIHYRHDPSDPSSLSSGFVAALYEDPDGDLWVGTSDGTLNRLREHDEITRYRPDPSDPSNDGGHPIYAIHGGRHGDLWIATDGGGLRRFDRRSETFVHYRHDPNDPESPGSDSAYGILEDREGALWFATRAGITRLDPRRQRFVAIRHRQGRRDDLALGVSALVEDPSGLLLTGTAGGGLTAFERGPGSSRGSIRYRLEPGGPEGVPEGNLRALLVDRRGGLWAGTSSGLARSVASRSVAPRFVPVAALDGQHVLSLLEDGGGSLWVGTLLGLYHFETSGQRPPAHHVHDPEDPTSLAGKAVYCLYEDLQGRPWAGTDDGLSRFEAASGKFVSHRHESQRTAEGEPPGLSAGVVTAVVEDSPGTFWIGTYGGGLDRWRPAVRDVGAEWRHYREKDGLADDKVVAILAAVDGDLWIATNGGLSRFDPAAETFRNYDVDDGLHGNLFFIGAALSSSRGEMLFGGQGGLTAFSPSKIEDDLLPPAVAVTGLFLQGEPAILRQRDPGSPLERAITETRELTFAPHQRTFTLEFAALHFANPSKNRYAFRLEGYDPDWIGTDAGHRRARYTNLDPGRYHFRVKAANGDGVWNEEGAAIRITIRSPFWRTWWFRAAAFTGLIGLLWSAHKLRLGVHEQRAEREKAAERERFIAELQAKNDELERFTYTVSHDLKAPIVTIKGFLGFLRRDVAAARTDPDAAERVERDIERVDGAAERMRVLVEDLLSLSRVGRTANPPEDVAFGDLVAEALELVAGQIRERGVEVVVAAGLPVVYGDRARLVELFQNLLENAVKYMGDQAMPRVEVGLRREGLGRGAGTAVFYVRDNGAGIAPEYHDKIFELFQRLDVDAEGSGVGLALVKRIVEVHGGRIWVESEGRGRGSTFCFTLPGETGEGGSPRA